MPRVDYMIWNWHYWVKRILRRPTCILGTGVRLYSSARIRNAQGSSEAIQIGAGCLVQGELLTFPDGRIEIGDYCFIGEASHIWAASHIKIRNRVLIAHNVNIFDNQTHSVDSTIRHQQHLYTMNHPYPKDMDLGARPVMIEDDVWIGCNAIILRGVTIGTKSIVGAGSVVTQNVPSGVLVAGNPAQIIKSVV